MLRACCEGSFLLLYSEPNLTLSSLSTTSKHPFRRLIPVLEREARGIISNAIAVANAEKQRPQPQENGSLLQQYSSATKTTPASTQFTFTCDSQVPGTVRWPGKFQEMVSCNGILISKQGHSSKHSMSTQTMPGMSAEMNGSNGYNHDGSSKAASRGSGSSRRKSRRRLEKELDMAARHRRRIAADNYYQNPPKAEDIWICEFCEYERIFGEPPRALIQKYEIKDRRHRQEEADRKRLLEKAKAKSRKGRKNAKAPARGQTTNQNTPPEPEHADPDAPPMNMGNGHSTQSEEDYVDGPDDHYLDATGHHSHRGDPGIPAGAT